MVAAIMSETTNRMSDVIFTAFVSGVVVDYT